MSENLNAVDVSDKLEIACTWLNWGCVPNRRGWTVWWVCVSCRSKLRRVTMTHFQCTLFRAEQQQRENWLAHDLLPAAGLQPTIIIILQSIFTMNRLNVWSINVEKMQIWKISQNPKSHLQIMSNISPKRKKNTMYYLECQKRSKSSHLRNWNQQLFNVAENDKSIIK